MASPSELSFADSLKSEQRRHFYERNRNIAIAMIVVVFLAPFVGVAVNGLAGAVEGIMVSIAAYYLTPYVVLKFQ